jgi:TatD DNase family protein
VSARDAGVATMLTLCTRVSRFEEIRAIAETDDNICCSVGMPGRASEGDSYRRDRLGLLLRQQLEGASGNQLPYSMLLIVQTRYADEDMASILEGEMGKTAFPGVLHCFFYDRRLAERALSMGFHISPSGIVTFKNAQDLRDIVKDVPVDRNLVETDAPFLVPMPNRGKHN